MRLVSLAFRVFCFAFFFNFDVMVLDNSVKFSEFGKSTEELKQLKVQLLEQEKTLREASEKERDIQEELANLKNRLEELESEKVAYDKGGELF